MRENLLHTEIDFQCVQHFSADFSLLLIDIFGSMVVLMAANGLYVLHKRKFEKKVFMSEHKQKTETK